VILPHKAPALARGGRQSERLRTGWRGLGWDFGRVVRAVNAARPLPERRYGRAVARPLL